MHRRASTTYGSIASVAQARRLDSDWGDPIGHIVDEKAIVNGMVGLLATGGSTNHTLHLVAIAQHDASVRRPGRVRQPLELMGQVAVKMLMERDPAKLPWADLEVDVVEEVAGVPGVAIFHWTVARRPWRRPFRSAFSCSTSSSRPASAACPRP
mgnify:CR=1 FL=1